MILCSPRSRICRRKLAPSSASAFSGQHELAAAEIAPRLRQQDRDLDRKHVLAVEVLVQAVVVALAILQQQRRRPRLPGVMTALQERRVRRGIADLDPHRLVPAVGGRRQPCIQRRPQLRDQIRQRIGEVFVFAAAKAVAAHHDPAAEPAVVGIERGDGVALVRRQQATENGGALPVEVGCNLVPIEPVDAGGNAGGWAADGLCCCCHGPESGP